MRRSEFLEQINLSLASKPKNDAEAVYQDTYKETEAASKRRDDRDALSLWRSMEKRLASDGRASRGWVLLAGLKAEALEKIIQRRRKTVEDLMAKATIPAPVRQLRAGPQAIARDPPRRPRPLRRLQRRRRPGHPGQGRPGRRGEEADGPAQGASA